MENEGWEVRSLLLTAARPEGVARIRSETVSGSFKITSVQHQVDNWQGRFGTHLSLRNLS